ncbi:MAG: hypothetical protein KBT20_01120 [Bacteroidales bacterium]|nr:hypothetical protein [Candidatus Liminaster caballi]
MKKFFLSIVLMCGITAAVAQKLPKWTTTPTAKGETAAMGEDREDAYRKAVTQLFDSFGMTTDPESFRQQLFEIDSTLVVDQRTPWVEAAMQSGYFKIKDTLATDTSYWVRCQIKPDELKQYLPELQQSVIQKGQESLTRARFVKDQGDLLLAAQQYAKGLNEVMPCIHKSLPSDALGGNDLAKTLFDEFLIVLDGLKLEATRKSSPMVKGEEIPLDLPFHLTSAKGKDVPSITMRAWSDDNGTKVKCSTPASITDHGGIVIAKVTKAPNADSGKINMGVDEKMLFLSIPENVATPLFKAHLTGKFPTASIDLVAFDPTPTIAVTLEERDQEFAPVIQQIVKQHGLVLAENQETADLELVLDCQSQMLSDAPEKHGDYYLATFRCNMNIVVQVRDSKAHLMEYKITDLDLLQPAYKGEEKIRARALKEMMKQVQRELPDRMSEVSYDKRKVVFK